MTDVNRSPGARVYRQLKPGVDDDIEFNDIEFNDIEFDDIEFDEASLELRQARTAYHVVLVALARSNLPSLTDFLG